MTRRRKFIKAVGATGLAGVAGCLGDDGDDTEITDDGDDADDVDDDTDDVADDVDPGEWPDLSGTELRFRHDEDSEASMAFWDNLAEEFEDATGATVQMEYGGIGAEGREELIRDIQAGTAPDLYYGNSSEASMFYLEGLSEPVTEEMETITEHMGEPDESNVAVVDGEHTIVPIAKASTLFYYRSDVTDEWGADNQPETWDDMLAYAEDAASDDLPGIYVPAGPTVQSFHLFQHFFQFDEQFMRWEDDEIVVNYESGSARETLVEVMDFLKELYEHSPPAADADWTTWINSVPGQNAASTVYPGFRPPLVSAQEEREFTPHVLGTEGVPAPPGGTNRGIGSAQGWIVFEGENSDAAKTYLEFAVRPERLMDQWEQVAPVHNFPPYQQIRDSDEYAAIIDRVIEDHYGPMDRDTIMNYINAPVQTRPNDTEPPNPYSVQSYESQPVMDMMVELLAGDVDPDTAIDNHIEEHKQLLADAQR